VQPYILVTDQVDSESCGREHIEGRNDMGWLQETRRAQHEQEIARWRAAGSFPLVLERVYQALWEYDQDKELLGACGYTVHKESVEASAGGTQTWHVSYVR
jgi:hypothetical protein